MKFNNIEIPVYLQKLMQYAGEYARKEHIRNNFESDYLINIEKSRRFLEIILSENLIKVVSEKVETEYKK